MKRIVFLLLIASSAFAGTIDNFNRSNGALGGKWVASGGQTGSASMVIVSNAIVGSNTLGVGNYAFSAYDSLITNVDSLRIGFTLNHFTTNLNGDANYNMISAEFGILTSKSLLLSAAATGWKVSLHDNHIGIVTYHDSTDEFNDLPNLNAMTFTATDTIYLEVRYGGDSAYVYRNSETAPLCRAGDPAWNLVKLGSGGYVHVGVKMTNDPTIFDNFILGKATTVVSTPASTLNASPIIASYTHVPNIVDTSISVYITAQVTDDNGLDSIKIYVETTALSDTYTLKKSIKVPLPRTKDTTITSLATAAKYAVGTYRYYVRTVDDSGAVVVSATKSFTVGTVSNLWRTAYIPTWSWMANGSSQFACPPEEMEMDGLTHIVIFDNGNVTQTSPYWAYMFGPASSAGVKPADVIVDSTGIEFNAIANPGDGIHRTYYLDSMVTIAHRNGVKVTITIQAVDAANLNYVAADSARTQLFVNTLVAWMERKHLDGVELDWEGWITPIPSSAIVNRFVRILYNRVHGMATSTGQPGIIMISAGGGDWARWDMSQDYMVDQFNLQTYDYGSAYHGAPLNSNATWYISPLFKGTDMVPFSTWMAYTNDTRGPLQWVENGHDVKKMGLGIPTFGQVVRDVDSLRRAYDGSMIGEAPYQVVEALKTNGGTETWDDIRKARWIHGVALTTTGTVSWGSNAVVAGHNFVATCESPQSIALKASWVKAQGFGGVMIYQYTSDYDYTKPKGNTLRHPLLNSLLSALGSVATITYPSVPVLSSPSSGATNQSRASIAMSWGTASNATSYDIEVSTNSTFTNVVDGISGIAATSVTMAFAPPLGYATTYYWHVRGVNANGTSAWSAPFTFVTASQYVSAPSAPTLVLPTSGATAQEITLALTWTPTDTITQSYQYQYGYDTVSATKQILSVSVPTATLSGLSYSATYNWHVRSVNNVGASAWSAWRAFTTKAFTTPPATAFNVFPITYNPLNGKVSNIPPPYFTVQATDSSNIPTPSAGMANISIAGIRLSTGEFRLFGLSATQTLTPDQLITQVNQGTQAIASQRVQSLSATTSGVVATPNNAKNKVLKTNALTGIPEWADGDLGVLKADIYTIGQPLALDSSMIVANRVFPLFIGNNEIIDTLFVITAGTGTFTYNLFSSRGNFTATDSLLNSPWAVSQTDTVVSKTTADMRNLANLGTKTWWMKIRTVTAKPDALVIQMKGHRQ